MKRRDVRLAPGRSTGLAQSKPLSHPAVIPRRSRKKIGFARPAAEAEAPMLVVKESELSATVCAAILKLVHKPLRYFGGSKT